MVDRFGWQGIVGFGLWAAAAMLLILAVAIPRLAFPHHADHLTQATLRFTVDQARLGTKLPPLRLQVVEAGPDPNRPAAHAEARLRWRGLFGIPFGETELGERQQSNDIDLRLFFGHIALFAAVELILLGSGGWLLVNAP